MSRARLPRTDAGETLIELLVAITIMGIAVVGVMAGLTTGVKSSASVRSNDATERVLVSVAALLEQAHYLPCTAAIAYRVPDQPGFAATDTVRYWDGAPSTAPLKYGPACPDGQDHNLERIQVTVTSTAAAGGLGGMHVATLEITKRGP